MKKIKKQAKPAKARPKHAASAVATGAKLAVLAGRPSKQAITAVFGSSGYALSWLARAERLGITPERLCAKFKADPQGVKAGKSSSGRSVSYEYDAPGRLAHVHDPQNGDEFYEYDPVNRLTSVSDAQRRPLLVNRYGYLGEIQSQTLADGSQLLYQTGYDESHRMDYFKLTLPNAYTIEWNLTRNGLTRSWPQAPRSLGTAINH